MVYYDQKVFVSATFLSKNMFLSGSSQMTAMLRTCVTSTGKFRVGVHRPSYAVRNLRDQDFLLRLGTLPDGTVVDNQANFPSGDVRETEGRWIYEIPNAFPCHGATYIDSVWAAARAENPGLIQIEPPPECSLSQSLGLSEEERRSVLDHLPLPLKYALAASSTDPEELILLAHTCCRMEFNGEGQPVGLKYLRPGKADIDDFELFETIANNPHLPDQYKEIMVLRPGVQGNSEIIGRYAEDTHVFEYLRRNSYIPWGHYAANMAHDAVRYRTSDLTFSDIRGLRHLYYQRMIVTLAERFGINLDLPKRSLTTDELESLRRKVLTAAEQSGQHPATLWGWNFGYDFSGSGYRLHASHQMIHQQYALTPEEIETTDGDAMPSYSCGDQVAEVIAQYGGDFFCDYLRCIRENKRTDRDPAKERSLIVHEDANMLLFVPKAQTSQWELQLMVIADADGQPIGNVLEADAAVRESIDRGILLAQHIFAKLGARMVTSLEYSKRIGIRNGQRLLYAFLPKLPWSMGAFSEAQHRYISSHFPEDFATACRRQIEHIQ
ncbi:MAG: hypothetical protein CDV28_10779 [Candidatus Electronema aureum]|uniref:Uncharacterized protein n=1 Tax=Candidatus Electronema aureum TaxID=2005002 RepID=A0A521G312_9BACT|nr:MAG: hypothetical protein CDV28_10779 [Candidatus Electronema aureum]